MYIIRKEKNADGAYSALQSWNSPNCPSTHWFYPDDLIEIFYPSDKRFAGFVNIEVDEATSTVTSATWDDEAYETYAEAHPEPTPEDPEPTEEEDISAMLVDQEMRLTALEDAVNNSSTSTT